MENNKKDPQNKKKYSAPKIEQSAEFETLALGCDKQNAGEGCADAFPPPPKTPGES